MQYNVVLWFKYCTNTVSWGLWRCRSQLNVICCLNAETVNIQENQYASAWLFNLTQGLKNVQNKLLPFCSYCHYVFIDWKLHCCFYLLHRITLRFYCTDLHFLWMKTSTQWFWLSCWRLTAHCWIKKMSPVRCKWESSGQTNGSVWCLICCM